MVAVPLKTYQNKTTRFVDSYYHSINLWVNQLELA
jgi:hypothetical protein